MDRRAFIGTLTGGLLAAPLTVEAQQARRPIIGVTLGGSQPNPYGEALRLALAERGSPGGVSHPIEWLSLLAFPELVSTSAGAVSSEPQVPAPPSWCRREAA